MFNKSLSNKNNFITDDYIIYYYFYLYTLILFRLFMFETIVNPLYETVDQLEEDSHRKFS